MANPGYRWGLAFGGIGLAAATLVLAMLGGARLILEFPIGIGFGVAATLVVAWWLGGSVAPRMANGSLRLVVTLGVGVALAALEAGIVLGSIPQLLGDVTLVRRDLGAALVAYVVKPLYWINLIGVVPAVLLGAGFGVVVSQADSHDSR